MLLLLTPQESAALLMETLTPIRLDTGLEGVDRSKIPSNFNNILTEIANCPSRNHAAIIAYVLTCLSPDTRALVTISSIVANFRGSAKITAPPIPVDEKWRLFLKFCNAKRVAYCMLDNTDVNSAGNHIKYIKKCQEAWTFLKKNGRLPPEID